MARYFVTGTDTGVGKTHVTSALAERGRRRGHRVFAWKPIETGCPVVDGRRVGADQEAISSAWQLGPLRGLYRFAKPASPLSAGQAEGSSISLEELLGVFAEGASGADIVLVEGAGGWRVSITPDVDMAELARRLCLPIIVVARGGLGTINHTLLTVEAIARDQQEIAAVVLSCHPTDDREFVAENAREIARRFTGRVVELWGESQVLDTLL